MKRIGPTLFGVLLGVVLLGEASPRQANGQQEISTEKLLVALRILNTQEYVYMDKNGRFADRGQILAFLRPTGLLSKSPIDLENPKPYELSITTTSDGMHYQIALQRPSDMNDESTYCKPAVFSDERGVIFLGQAIYCDAAPR